MIAGIPRQQFIALAVLYTIAHGGLLVIMNAIYWDDWVLWGMAPDLVLETFRQAGSMFNVGGYLHVAMLAAGPWLYKFLTFVLIFISGVLLWHILARNLWIGDQSRFLIVLFYLVTPFYAARVALIDFPYTLGLFLFIWAWWAMDRKRLLALVLFFLCFNINSLLVLYALPMLDHFLRKVESPRPLPIVKYAVSRVDFIALPILYWVIKAAYYAPSGFYDGYNANFSAMNIVFASIRTAFAMTEVSVAVWLLLVVVAAMLILRRELPMADPVVADRKLFAAGALALVLGLFPYLILGYVPYFWDWHSRHQLLMPIGTAILLVWLVGVMRADMQRMLVGAVIALSLAMNIQTYTEYALDWHQQKKVIAAIAHSPEVRDADVILFDDQAPNAKGRKLRFYEWSGMLKRVFDDETRFGLHADDYEKYTTGYYDQYFSPLYNAGEHRRTDEPVVARVLIEKYEVAAAFRWRALYQVSIQGADQTP